VQGVAANAVDCLVVHSATRYAYNDAKRQEFFVSYYLPHFNARAIKIRRTLRRAMP
jgi:hypothetical protein